jgi:hypothetical protein
MISGLNIYRYCMQWPVVPEFLNIQRNHSRKNEASLRITTTTIKTTFCLIWENCGDVRQHSTLLGFFVITDCFFIQSFHNYSQTGFHWQVERTTFKPVAAYNYNVNIIFLIASRLQMSLGSFPGRDKMFFSSWKGLKQVRDLANEYREQFTWWG